MLTYLKRARKLSYIYLMCLVIFFIASIGIIGVFHEESYNRVWIFIISGFSWFYGIYAWYLEGRTMGKNDKIPYYSLKLNPLRGFLAGIITLVLIAVSAFIISYILVLLYSLLTLLIAPGPDTFSWNNDFTVTLYTKLIKFSFSPFYWLANFWGNKAWLYPIVSLTYPAGLTAGYTLGLYKSGAQKLKKEINKK